MAHAQIIITISYHSLAWSLPVAPHLSFWTGSFLSSRGFLQLILARDDHIDTPPQLLIFGLYIFLPIAFMFCNLPIGGEVLPGALPCVHSQLTLTYLEIESHTGAFGYNEIVSGCVYIEPEPSASFQASMIKLELLLCLSFTRTPNQTTFKEGDHCRRFVTCICILPTKNLSTRKGCAPLVLRSSSSFQQR